MYKIYLDENKESQLVIHLNSVPLLCIPKAVLIGVGNIKNRYANWLKKTINEKEEMLHILCRVHLEAVKAGSVSLVTIPKFKHFHGVVIKEYLEENASLLNTVMPYVFPKEELPEAIKEANKTSDASDALKNIDWNDVNDNADIPRTVGLAIVKEEMTPIGGSTQMTMDEFRGMVGEDAFKQITDQIEQDQVDNNSVKLHNQSSTFGKICAGNIGTVQD